jgi:hypothetical protein
VSTCGAGARPVLCVGRGVYIWQDAEHNDNRHTHGHTQQQQLQREQH